MAVKITYRDCVEYSCTHKEAINSAVGLFPYELKGSDYHSFSIGYAYARLIEQNKEDGVEEVEIERYGVNELGDWARQEKEAIRRALQDANGNREEAARILGKSPRTIYRKIKQYGIKED